MAMEGRRGVPSGARTQHLRLDLADIIEDLIEQLFGVDPDGGELRREDVSNELEHQAEVFVDASLVPIVGNLLSIPTVLMTYSASYCNVSILPTKSCGMEQTRHLVSYLFQ